MSTVGIRPSLNFILAELGLKDRNDPLTETVAKLIVEIAQTGEKDPKTICTFALRRLNEPDRAAC